VIRRLAFPALILIGLSLAAGPLFIGPAPPMTDFCQHALVAHMMNHYEDSQLNYQAYFTRDHSYRTMYLAQLLLSLLERIGGAILGARLFLVLFVALLYLGTYAFARSRKVRGPEWIALGSLPLAFSWPVYSGFLPFVVTAWEKARNARKAPIHWAFTLAVARQKLRKLYPTIED